MQVLVSMLIVRLIVSKEGVALARQVLLVAGPLKNSDCYRVPKNESRILARILEQKAREVEQMGWRKSSLEYRLAGYEESPGPFAGNRWSQEG